MNRQTLFMGLFIFLGYSFVQGQTFDIKKLSTNEGLPSGQIGEVVQDDAGFIWLSTYDGVIRYDGFKTKTYSVENGLRNNIISTLFIDSQQRFWVSTEQAGVGMIKGDTVIYPEDLSPLDSLTITHINESMDGRIWFSTYGSGVLIWDGTEFEQLTKEDGLPSNYTWEIWFSKKGEAWIGSWAGIGIFDGDSIRVVNKENGLSDFSAYTFAEDLKGDVWVSTSSGLSKFDGEEWHQIHEINGKELGYIYDVAVDEEGIVWIGTEHDGIYWCDGNSFTHINKKNGLSSNYIYKFYEDNEGNMWVATDENGVNIFRNKYFRIYSGNDFIEGESVNVLTKKGSDIWVGTDIGITQIKEKGTTLNWEIPDALAKYKEVWDLELLPDGSLLIETSNSKLIKFDGKNFTDYGALIKLPYSLYIQDVSIQDEKIWIGTESGLVRYEDDTYTYYTVENGLSDNLIWSLYEDQNGNMWASGDQGINRVVGDSVISYTFEDGIAGNSMNLITQSPAGNYWIGTNIGFTELLFDKEMNLKETRNFTIDDEFLKESQFLQFDDQGNLWQGTSAGIHFFDEAKLDTAQSGVIDGMFFPLQNYGKGLEMNFMASLMDDKGNLYFGSYTDGLVKYIGNSPKVQEAPKVFLQNFFENGESVSFQKDTLNSFKYSKNNISIKFGAFYFQDPDRVFYKYRLKGFQDHWAKIYGKNEVSYTNLPPGIYSFEIQTKSTHSEWGQPATLATFQIRKPFWNTFWFYLLVITILAVSVAAIIKILLIYFEKRELDQLVDERTEDLKLALDEKEVLIKEIHHRVKNNMAVVSGLLDLQGWKMKDGEAKMAIENSKLRIQTMASIHEKIYQNKDLAHINFKSFVEDLTVKVARSLKGADKEVKVDLDIDDCNINVNSAIPCGLILNEALCNSFEHAFKDTNKGTVQVRFKDMESSYLLEIKDNGIGFPETLRKRKLATLGVTLINSLATQIKGTADFITDDGTTVRVTFPK